MEAPAKYGSIKYGSIIEGSTEYYPGKRAVVVFLGGCPFRCGYCYSGPIVVASEHCLEMPVDEMAAYLARKRTDNEAVVFTGAEPLQQWEPLTRLCTELRQKGIAVRIETNGFYPDALERILPFVSCIALDIKTGLDADKYAAITAFRGEPATLMQQILLSLIALRAAKKRTPALNVEVRTTVIAGVNDSPECIDAIAREAAFADTYALAQFVAEGTLIDLAYQARGTTSKMKLAELAEIALAHCANVVIRTQEDGEQKVEKTAETETD
ncbi:MAG: radical SAM protein [Candidatus Micrarchaeota archaeon]